MALCYGGERRGEGGEESRGGRKNGENGGGIEAEVCILLCVTCT